MSTRHPLQSDAALELIASRFKALAEPARLKLLQALHSGEKNVSALVEETGLTQANASRHLQILVENGILVRRRDGQSVFYSIGDMNVLRLCSEVCGGVKKHHASKASSVK